MNNKLNNLLNDFLKENEVASKEELDKKLQEFMMKYNMGLLQYENTSLDDAYELLDQAENAKSKKEAIRLAQEAYKKDPACFDAIIFLSDLENSRSKRDALLEEGLEKERKRLEQQNFFTKENKGIFYGLFETRPYMRGLYTKAYNLVKDGKMRQAIEVCKEILKLNENDNLGARYLLLAIYAYLEEEKDLLKLVKKYDEENLEILFPLLKGDTLKATQYVEEINKANPHVLKLFKGTFRTNHNETDYYKIGEASEVMMYLNQYIFLFISTPGIEEFFIEKSKKKK